MSKSDDERKLKVKQNKKSPKSGYILDLKKTLALK